jgi:hypothetical protein
MVLQIVCGSGIVLQVLAKLKFHAFCSGFMNLNGLMKNLF